MGDSKAVIRYDFRPGNEAETGWEVEMKMCARTVVRRWLFVPLSLFVLAGCAISIVEDYDPVLDEGLSNYQADVAAFIAKMASVSGKPAGAFGNADVQEYYARTGARLQSFVDRAEALDKDGKCLTTDFVGKGVKKVVVGSSELLQNIDLPFGKVKDMASVIESFGDGSEDITSGNCTVVVVKVVQANQELLKLIHEENDSLPPIVASIAGETIQQSVRIAIKNEVLKKSRAN